MTTDANYQEAASYAYRTFYNEWAHDPDPAVDGSMPQLLFYAEGFLCVEKDLRELTPEAKRELESTLLWFDPHEG